MPDPINPGQSPNIRPNFAVNAAAINAAANPAVNSAGNPAGNPAVNAAVNTAASPAMNAAVNPASTVTPMAALLGSTRLDTSVFTVANGNLVSVRPVLIERLSPEEQNKLYGQVLETGMKDLGTIAESLQKTLKETQGQAIEKSNPLLRDRLTQTREGLGNYQDRLDAVLGIATDDVDLLRKRLAQSQAALAENQQKLEQEQLRADGLERQLKERQGFIDRQQAQITDFQKRNAELEKQIGELEQRTAIEPAGFGDALGHAVDAIQAGLTNLANPQIDYALQELDLQTQVNLQINNQGKLLIRFPGVNESIPVQNLSQMQLRLRPIPKSQQAVAPTPDPSPAPTPRSMG
jgi:hypothetical protein